MDIEKLKNRILYGVSELEDAPDYATRLTMLPRKTLENIEECIRKIVEDKIEGDFVETGVWRGGACIFANALFKKLNSPRKIYVYDSFEGLPVPDAEKYPMDSGDTHYQIPELSVSLDTVISNFKLIDEDISNIVFVKGWFKDTVKDNNIDKIAILRLDGDMYESTVDPINYLYPKVNIGGFCIVDDYNPKFGAHHVANSYRADHNISEELQIFDGNSHGLLSAYWRKLN